MSTAYGIFRKQFRNLVLRLFDHEIVWINLILIRRKLHSRQCSNQFLMWDGFTWRFPSWFISSRNGCPRAWFCGKSVITFGLPAHKFLKRIAVGSIGMVAYKKTSIGKLQKVCVTKCRLQLAVWHVLNLNRKLIHYGLALLQLILQLIFFMSIERERVCIIFLNSVSLGTADFFQCIHFLYRSITRFSKKLVRGSVFLHESKLVPAVKLYTLDFCYKAQHLENEVVTHMLPGKSTGFSAPREVLSCEIQ